MTRWNLGRSWPAVAILATAIAFVATATVLALTFDMLTLLIGVATGLTVGAVTVIALLHALPNAARLTASEAVPSPGSDLPYSAVLAAARFVEMFQQHSAPQLMINPADGQIKDANPAAAAFYGYSQNELRSMLISQINTDTRQNVRMRMSDAVSRQSSAFFFRHKLASGEIRDVEVHSAPIKIADETFLHSIIHDITDRKRLQRELERLIQTSPNVVAIFDAEGGPYLQNKAAERLFGLDTETGLAALDRATLLAHVHPDDRAATARVFSAKCPCTGDDRIAALDNRVRSAGHHPDDDPYRYISWSVSDAADRFYVIGRDTTELHKLLEAERTARENASLYFNSAQVLMVIVDEAGRIVKVNRYFEELLEWSNEEISDEYFLDYIILPEDRDRISQVFNDIVSGRFDQTSRVVNSVVTRSGAQRLIEWRNAIIRNDDGAIVGCVSSGLDVTEREQAAKALVDARDRAEAANEAKSQFLAVMSHELRTPLNSVLGFAQLLQSSYADDRSNGYINNIIESGEHLLSLIQDILDVSQLAGGPVNLAVDRADAGAIVSGAVDGIRSAVAAKGLTLDLHLPEIPLEIDIDPQRLQQIVSNLLSNAMKFTRKGGVTVRLYREAEPDLGEPLTTTQVKWMRIEVTDTGVGMSPSEQNRLFEPFFLVDSSLRRTTEGVGVGLAIVKRLVVAMGGTIDVESASGVGSSFKVRLPITVQPAKTPERHAPPMRLPVRANSHRLKVLIAEDNEMNGVVLETIVAKLGYETTLVQDGLAALRAINHEHHDIVLMDIHMPVMDGMTATRAIRGLNDPRRSGVPIVGVTADAGAQQVRGFMDAGMDQVLAKPVKMHEIKSLFAVAHADGFIGDIEGQTRH